MKSYINGNDKYGLFYVYRTLNVYIIIYFLEFKQYKFRKVLSVGGHRNRKKCIFQHHYWKQN